MASRTSLRRHQGSAPEEPAATNAGGNASNCYELTVVPGNLKERPNTITFLPLFGDGNSDRWPKLDGQPGVGGSTFVRLGKEHEKNRIWRSLAADYIARELGLYDDGEHCFMLYQLRRAGWVLCTVGSRILPFHPGEY